MAWIVELKGKQEKVDTYDELLDIVCGYTNMGLVQGKDFKVINEDDNVKEE